MSLTLRSLLLPAVVGLSLSAQDALTFKWEISGGPILATPALTKATENKYGYAGAVGLTAHLPGPGLDLRFGLGYNVMPGKTRISTKTDLKSLQLTLDVYMATWTKNLTWFMGFSGNKYTATNSGYEIMGTAYTQGGAKRVAALDAFSVKAGKDDKGIKGGLRLGLNYAFNSHLALELLFQQTELSGGFHVEPKVHPDYPNGYANMGAMNPSWFQLGVKYTF